ncbi:MAG: ATP-binding cassette domain-containing protein [Pirellulaceae bacterium]
MAEVVLESVSKRFPDGTFAVSDLSLNIADQEFLVLVGPSGCGKSTTLRMIAGLEQPTGGTVRIGSRVVNNVAPKDRDIAMVFQNYALYPHMSVYRNLSFGLELRYGGGFVARCLRRVLRPAQAAQLSELRAGIDAQVRQAARRLDIEALLDRKPHQLSGGERQRVALGRAIVRNPAAFLFDEPLSNLDAKLRQQMRVGLKQLHSTLSATMIYVTHDQIEAMTLGDRVAVMNQGKLQQVAPPQEIYRKPVNLFVARFFGSTPMNLVTGRLLKRESGWCFQSGEWEWCLGAAPPDWDIVAWPEEVVLGFRAEDVVIGSVSDSPDVRVRVQSVDHWGESAVLLVEPPQGVGPRGQEIENRNQGVAKKMDEADSLIWCARAAGDTTVADGEMVGLTLRVERCHWFDAKTGMNITAKQS